MKKMKPLYSKFYLVILLFSLFACKEKNVNMPIAVNNQTENRNGEIIWIDFITKDAAKSQTFFKELFGWEYTDYGIYKLATHNNKPVCGIIQDPKIVSETNSAYWITSISVSNIEHSLENIKNNGGKVIAKPLAINKRGKTTLAIDPQGALFALLETPNGAPKATKPTNNELIWAELWTNDPSKSVDFYQKTLHIKSRKINNYYILKGTKYEYGAITKIPVANEKPIWIPVLKVANVTETLAKAKKLGGKSIIKPTKVSGNTLALISTPDGAPFLIQQIN